MNNRIEFGTNGGLPLTQDLVDFMQQAYAAGINAISAIIGNNVILDGLVVTGSTISDGYVCIAGEILPFQGGAVGTDIIIQESVGQETFEDLNTHDVYFSRKAIIGSGPGAIPLSSFVRIDQLKQMYLDIQEVNPYVAVTNIPAVLEPDFGLGFNFIEQFSVRRLSGIVIHTNAGYTGLKKLCDVPAGFTGFFAIPCMMELSSSGSIVPSYLVLTIGGELKVYVDGECSITLNHINY